jgi:hypothetical protein
LRAGEVGLEDGQPRTREITMSETHSGPPLPEAPDDRWGRGRAPLRQAEPQSALHRFLGGTPITVLFRLVLVSAVVGAVLMWLRIRPIDIIRNVEDLIHQLWGLGFDAIREAADYIVAGAVIVIPIWLVVRLLNFRSGR